jgi:BirA family biotin operon repressor/biotin-[acetyl-CoA-carboxylase] ligase
MTASELEHRLENRPFRFFPSVDSTNAYARLWVRSDEPPASGSLVVADEQTGGRGRFERRWVTPPGDAVAMSVIMRPRKPRRLAPAAGLAVCEAVEPLVRERLALKWPNDVLLAGKKVAGILVESVGEGGGFVYIVGIGINVSVSFERSTAEPGLAETATSIVPHLQERGRPVDRARLVANVAAGLEEWEARGDLWRQWKARLAMLGHPVVVHLGRETVSGTAEDVDEEGNLLLRDSSGAVRTVSAGDVTLSAHGFNKQG